MIVIVLGGITTTGNDTVAAARPRVAPYSQTIRLVERRMPRLVTPRIRTIIAIVLTMLITLPFAFTASAQDLDATAGKLNLTELDGIEAAVSRTYSLDIGTLVDTASKTPAPADVSGPLLMLALVARFDTEDHAADAVTDVRDALTGERTTELNGIQLEASELDAPGDTAWALTGPDTASTAIDGLIVQDAEWLYLAMAISNDGSGGETVHDLITFSLQHRESTDEIIYDHTGRSRGGIWARLPGAGDATALGNTQPIFDTQVLPATTPGDE